MANKRMFSKEITNTDRFQSLKLSAQALYFHLGINADDDGFIGNPLSITKCIGASPGDLKILVDSGYLIPFNGGVYLITDWFINNYIRADRRKTVWSSSTKARGMSCAGQLVYQWSTQIRVV